MKDPKNSLEDIAEEDFQDCSVGQLLFLAEESMPDAKLNTSYNWSRFTKIVEELRSRQGVTVQVLAGAEMKQEGVVYDFQMKKRNPSDYHSVMDNIGLSRELSDGEEGLLYFTLENFVQHVKQGVGLVFRAEKSNEVQISVIDNGTGFVDAQDRRVPISDALVYARQFGIGGEAGVGFPKAFLDTDLILISQPGEVVIGQIGPDDWDFNVIFSRERSAKKYGVFINGFFYTGNNLEEYLNQKIERLKSDYEQKSSII